MGNFTVKDLSDRKIRDEIQRSRVQLPEREERTCYICGRPATHAFYVRTGEQVGIYTLQTQRCYCRECSDKILEEKIQKKIEYHRSQGINAITNAQDLLERRGIDMIAGREIWSQMMKEAETRAYPIGSRFEAAALFLCRTAGIYPRLGMLIQTPQEGKQQHTNELDLYIHDPARGLPALDLEIDGGFHAGGGQADTERDAEILSHYPGLHIIRIGADYLQKHPRYLVRDITLISELLKRLREQHGGRLPEGHQIKVFAALYHMRHPRLRELMSHSLLYLLGDEEERRKPKRQDGRDILLQGA